MLNLDVFFLINISLRDLFVISETIIYLVEIVFFSVLVVTPQSNNDVFHVFI